MMFKLSTIIRLIAIAIGTTVASTYSLPLNAQNNRLKNTNLNENITSTEELNWSFSSENESILIQDDLRELKQYSISDEDNADTDFKLTENSPKWGNRGDVEDYSFEVEVYDY